jgi:hypothetical protein
MNDFNLDENLFLNKKKLTYSDLLEIEEPKIYKFEEAYYLFLKTLFEYLVENNVISNYYNFEYYLINSKNNNYGKSLLRIGNRFFSLFMNEIGNKLLSYIINKKDFKLNVINWLKDESSYFHFKLYNRFIIDDYLYELQNLLND